MIVLLVGSGGREHAIAWKIAQSPRLERLLVAPGNPGTASFGENIPVDAEDIPALVSLALKRKVDLVIVGPEAPLAAGLVDALQQAEIRAFGPSQAAAQIEASKAFAKVFMRRHAIPSARYAVFSEYAPALQHLRSLEYPVVIKASGLAAGKGVVVPDTGAQAEAALRSMLLEGEFGDASQMVVIEERLSGPEVSLLAFCDGHTLRPMPPAQDHKRLLDGDRGSNTGGMGAYAPAPVCPPELVEQVVQSILQPAVDGLRLEGNPFVGVLYAGLMLTAGGPRVLEFNCRFGDPETQALLPLLESDLLEVAAACVDGRLGRMEIRWKNQSAACVVLASEGYPGKAITGRAIRGLDQERPDSLVFQAGTRQRGGTVVTAGGRVLGVTGLGSSLSTALQAAYMRIESLSFAGMQFRQDIGQKGLADLPAKTGTAISYADTGMNIDAVNRLSYAATGVNIDAGNRAVDLMRSAVKSTYGPQVLAGIGAFGGLYDAAALTQMDEPVLVASTDGVGTKTMIASAMGRYDTMGYDIVNHCVNDILVQGARPLFFLDYVAASKLDSDRIAIIVRGCAEACRAVGCVLLGGETAEMPGVYQPEAFDLVGTMVGWVERAAIVDGSAVRPGDVCLGLPSSGLHTNGYSLARRVLADTPWETILPELGKPLGEVLLTPHRAYLKELETLWAAGVQIKAMAHITGGGFTDNIPRVLPAGIGVRIDRAAWQAPAIFRLIRERGHVDAMEMYRVFNMGIGIILLVSPVQVNQAQVALSEAVIIGEAVAWDGNTPRVHL